MQCFVRICLHSGVHRRGVKWGRHRPHRKSRLQDATGEAADASPLDSIGQLNRCSRSVSPRRTVSVGAEVQTLLPPHRLASAVEASHPIWFGTREPIAPRPEEKTGEANWHVVAPFHAAAHHPDDFAALFTRSQENRAPSARASGPHDATPSERLGLSFPRSEAIRFRSALTQTLRRM